MDYLWTPWRYAYVSGIDQYSGCVFCDLPRAGNDAKVGIVHRGRNCYVILNAYPYTAGHVMIVPSPIWMSCRSCQWTPPTK